MIFWGACPQNHWTNQTLRKKEMSKEPESKQAGKVHQAADPVRTPGPYPRAVAEIVEKCLGFADENQWCSFGYLAARVDQAARAQSSRR